MFKKVLFPTDFSECSESVIPYLKKLKKSGTREVVVIHVIDSRYSGFIETVGWFGETVQQYESDMYENIKGEAEKQLERIRKKLSPFFKVKIRIENGVPFKMIMDIAEKERVSLIVLGSHGKSNIEEMLLGSVSEKVIRKSKKPCLVIKR
jgi:nucleotide-binding universal stress UspA family protein